MRCATHRRFIRLAGRRPVAPASGSGSAHRHRMGTAEHSPIRQPGAAGGKSPARLTAQQPSLAKGSREGEGACSNTSAEPASLRSHDTLFDSTHIIASAAARSQHHTAIVPLGGVRLPMHRHPRRGVMRAAVEHHGETHLRGRQGVPTRFYMELPSGLLSTICWRRALYSPAPPVPSPSTAPAEQSTSGCLRKILCSTFISAAGSFSNMLK